MNDRMLDLMNMAGTLRGLARTSCDPLRAKLLRRAARAVDAAAKSVEAVVDYDLAKD